MSNNLTLDIGVRYDNHKGWVDPSTAWTWIPIPRRVDPRQGYRGLDQLGPAFRLRLAANRRRVGAARLHRALPRRNDLGRLVLAAAGRAGPWNTYWLNWDGEWEVLSSWETTPDAFLIPGTENASTWEYTLGFDQQIGATSAIGVQAVYKTTTNQIGWYIDDDGEYEDFDWTDPETGNTYTLRDYSVDPTRYKGNSSGPGAAEGR